MNLTGTPSRAAIAAAMSGETPDGSPFGHLPVTSRKFPILIAARKTPVGANSETICGVACTGIGRGSRSDEGGSQRRRILGELSATRQPGNFTARGRQGRASFDTRRRFAATLLRMRLLLMASKNVPHPERERGEQSKDAGRSSNVKCR